MFLASLCSGDEGERKTERKEEPEAGAPWEWQPSPKIRRETKTRKKAKIEQKGDGTGGRSGVKANLLIFFVTQVTHSYNVKKSVDILRLF